MIRIENTEVVGWEAAIHGMRNPKNSWDKGDSGLGCNNKLCSECGFKPNWRGFTPMYTIGPNDIDLMKRLRNAGTDHRKFMRMIVVYVDVTAPLYWWKEFDTYKVGTVANSCSTMHKIHAKEFTLEDFSHEHLRGRFGSSLKNTVVALNQARETYLETKDKEDWWQMIQLLPSSYNQKRTVMMNYEVLANIYKSRRNHKLDEWAEHKESKENKELIKNFASGKFGFCDWIKTLPYSELITGEMPQC